MKVAREAALLALAPLAAAYWRLQCHGVAGIGMIDPIADPDVTAAHAHTIKGANGLTPSSTADDLLKSDCTSCQITQDKSGYWAPQLYFQNKNGSFMMVPEVAGHITYYKYTPVYNHNGTLMYPEAMPNGLRAISGDKTRRNFTLAVPDPPRPWSGKDATQDALAQKAIGFNCLNYAKAPENTLYRHFLPDKEYLETECPDGIRMEVLFPQCWNGKLDSPDHQSHLAFPDQGVNGGSCPEGYDQNTMQLLFETIYPTGMFKGVDGTYALSTGDPTGYSYHGDFLIAWEEGVLQQALDQCGSDTTGDGTTGVTADCPVFKLQDPDKQAVCKIGDSVLDKVDGNLAVDTIMNKLPGHNPMEYGPQPATAHAAPASSGLAGIIGGILGGASSEAAPSDTPMPSTKVVPTLSYSQGSANVFVAGGAPTPTPAASHSTTLVQSVITSAPAAPSPAAPAGNQVTTTYTSNGIVYHEVIVEDVDFVTKDMVVTVTEAAPGYGRRAEHRARHIHGDFHRRGH